MTVSNGRGLAFGLLVVFSILNADADESVIYGPDNRKDYFEVRDPGTLQRSDSTVVLIKRRQISLTTRSDTKIAQISAANYGASHGLCPNEKFVDQPNAGFCSGSLVGPDLIVTAGHCIKDMVDCQDANFVFGYKMIAPGRYPTAVAVNEVYSCRTLVARKLEQTPGITGTQYGADFAIIQLDRPVTGHSILPVSRGGAIQVGTPLVMIGYPAGLPAKIEAGGRVIRSSQKAYFDATTDSYHGNSGSAVFNAQTGQIEGVLVRGEDDFELTSAGCRVSKVCPPNGAGCRGESITRASEFVGYLAEAARRRQ